MMAENAFPTAKFAPHSIVVGADGSEISYQAVVWAAVEAESRRCPLHIVTSFGLPIGREPGEALSSQDADAIRAEGKRVLADACRIARHAAPGGAGRISTELTCEPAIPALLELSRTARMVVVGNRGRGAIRRALLGSVSTALTRHADCPVAVVPGVPETATAAAAEPVVVGADGSDNSVPAIEMAFDEASRRKTRLVVVHAWSDTSGFDLQVVGWQAIRETEDMLLRDRLAASVSRCPDVDVTRVITWDTPVRALLDRAEGAQLLVVGTHGRSRLAGAVLGSVTTGLLHAATCPVLVVRQPASQAEGPGKQ